MNAKDIYDAVEIEEEDSLSGRLVKAKLVLNSHYMIQKKDLEDGYESIAGVHHLLRQRIIGEVYGKISDILSKYDALIHWGLAASGDEDYYSQYRAEISDFFDTGDDYES